MPPQFQTQFNPINNVPAPENNSVQQKPPYNYTFLIVLTILLILTGVFGIWYFSNPLPTEEADGSTSLTTSKFADWKTYRNEEYGFEIKYPSEFTYTTNSYSRGFQVLFTGSSAFFTVNVRNDELGLGVDLKNYFYLDFSPKEQTTLADQTAYIYEAPDGYCDGPGCSEPFLAIATRKNTTIYIVEFKGDIQINNIEKEILSTFKFISTSTNSTQLLKVCPDEWVQDDMPTVMGLPKDRQYYILEGKRRELSEFENEWIKNNCDLEKQIVY